MSRFHSRSTLPALRAWAMGGFLAGVALALVGLAPAHWLGWALELGSDARVQLRAARGSVWDGSAQLVFTGGAGSRDEASLPGRIQWQLHPGWGRLQLRLQASCCTTQSLEFWFQPRWGGVNLALQDSESQWPAALLAGLGTPWNTLQPQGSLSVSTQGLVLDLVQGRVALDGKAQLVARDVSSRLSTLHPMGSYQLKLQGGASTTLQLETLQGSLQLSGSGRWVNARLHFEGTASAAPEQEDALSNLLNIIGRRNGAQSVIQVG